MAGYQKLPEDYAINALSLEAQRRGRILGRGYSYGMLVADTTPEEREQIAERYRKRMLRQWISGSGERFDDTTEADAAENIIRKKHYEDMAGD